MPTQEQLAQDRAYAFLKESIITLGLKPNERLRTADIAGSLGLSRTPVREALSKLEQEGLVRRDGGWGYAVVNFTVKDAIELYGVRSALETEAAHEAMRQVTDRDIVALRKILDDSEAFLRAESPHEFLRQSRRFHQTIVKIAANTLLEQMLGMIHDRIRLVAAITVWLNTSRCPELLAENRAILQALAARDSAGLDQSMREHLDRGRDRALQLLAAGAEVDAA